MQGKDRHVVGFGWLATAMLLVVGCGPSAEIREQLAEAEIVAAQKDSLVQAVAEYAQVMSEISAELAAVDMAGQELLIAAESPVATSRDSVLGKIRAVNARLEESETRLRQSRGRIRRLTHLSDSLRATMDSTIANYENVLATHRESIETLTERVTGLQAETEALAAEVSELEDEVTEASTVYYAIATKDELLERGIIEKQGGARTLFIFGKRGETLVPGRDLSPDDFTAIDSREISEIPLPNPEVAYQVVSLHNLAFLENVPDEDGKISGSIRIASPSEFWSASPFLILVEE